MRIWIHERKSDADQHGDFRGAAFIRACIRAGPGANARVPMIWPSLRTARHKAPPKPCLPRAGWRWPVVVWLQMQSDGSCFGFRQRLAAEGLPTANGLNDVEHLAAVKPLRGEMRNCFAHEKVNGAVSDWTSGRTVSSAFF